MRVALSAFVVLVAGCSSDKVDEGTAFTGSWQCQTKDVITYTEPAGSPGATIPSTDSLLVTSTGNGLVSAATYVDAGRSCSLTYATSGDNATLSSGQTCVTATLTFTYQSGAAQVSNGTLTTTTSYTFTGTGAGADGGTESYAGSGTSSSTCTR